MNTNIKRYKLKLTTLAPVFIGSGLEIGKREYVFANNVIYVIDPKKLMDIIVRKGLTEKYTEFMSHGGKTAENLYKFLSKNNIGDFKAISSYVLSGVDNINDKRSLKGIQTFIKDAYGKPYIPGSSLKGMLRTIILWDDIYERLDDDDIKHIIREAKKAVATLNNRAVKKNLGNVSNKLEDIFFTETKNNVKVSKMRGVSVSDSKPLKLSDLTLCEKLDISVKNTQKRPNVMKVHSHISGEGYPESVKNTQKRPNVMRECLKPGVCVEFDLRIDESIIGLTLDDLRRHIENYSMDYSDLITCEFMDCEKETNALYLGGGAGYFSKTVSYRLFNKYDAVKLVSEYLEKTTRKEHKHYNDKIISPHMLKCTIYNGKKYEMGKCKIDIEFAV